MRFIWWPILSGFIAPIGILLGLFIWQGRGENYRFCIKSDEKNFCSTFTGLCLVAFTQLGGLAMLSLWPWVEMNRNPVGNAEELITNATLIRECYQMTHFRHHVYVPSSGLHVNKNLAAASLSHLNDLKLMNTREHKDSLLYKLYWPSIVMSIPMAVSMLQVLLMTMVVLIKSYDKFCCMEDDTRHHGVPHSSVKRMSSINHGVNDIQVELAQINTSDSDVIAKV